MKHRGGGGQARLWRVSYYHRQVDFYQDYVVFMAEDVPYPIGIPAYQVGGHGSERHVAPIGRDDRVTRTTIPFRPVRSQRDAGGRAGLSVVYEDIKCPNQGALRKDAPCLVADSSNAPNQHLAYSHLGIYLFQYFEGSFPAGWFVLDNLTRYEVIYLGKWTCWT